MAIIATPQPVSLTSLTPSFRTSPVAIDPLTSAVSLRLRRPTTAFSLDWRESDQVRTHIVIIMDGVEYRCTGRATGGMRQVRNGVEVAAYQLIYRLPIGWFGATSGLPKRLGELSRISYRAFVEIELVQGSPTLIVEAFSTEQAAPAWSRHNTVVFDAATSALEMAGDGVLSLTHTSTGTNRGVFGGVGVAHTATGTSTSLTYGGTGMTEQWDVDRFVTANDFLINAGYTLANQATGAQTVTSTMNVSPGYSHALGVISMIDVHQTTPVGTAPTPGQGTLDTASVTVANVVSGGLVVSNLASFWNGATPGADEIERWERISTANDTTYAGNTQASSAGGVMSMTRNFVGFTDDWILGGIEFKPLGGGITSADGSAIGTSTVSGIGAALWLGLGSSQAIAQISGIGAVLWLGLGSSQAIAQVSAISSAFWNVIGNSIGTSLVNADGEDANTSSPEGDYPFYFMSRVRELR